MEVTACASSVGQSSAHVGPSSVANRLETEALCFGGGQCTGTDVAVASGVAPMSICGGEEGRVKVGALETVVVYAAMREIHHMLEAAIDSVKVATGFSNHSVVCCISPPSHPTSPSPSPPPSSHLPPSLPPSLPLPPSPLLPRWIKRMCQCCWWVEGMSLWTDVWPSRVCPDSSSQRSLG